MTDTLNNRLKRIDRGQTLRTVIATVFAPFLFVLLISAFAQPIILPMKNLWLIGFLLIVLIGLPLHFYLLGKNKVEIQDYIGGVTYVLLICMTPFALPLLLTGLIGAVFVTGALVWILPTGIVLALCFWAIVRPDVATNKIRKMIDENAKRNTYMGVTR